MSDEFYAFLMKLPRANLINLLDESLDLMQQYNGRSRMTCIMMALNAKEIEEGKWERPTLKAAKEATKNGSLY